MCAPLLCRAVWVTGDPHDTCSIDCGRVLIRLLMRKRRMQPRRSCCPLRVRVCGRMPPAALRLILHGNSAEGGKKKREEILPPPNILAKSVDMGKGDKRSAELVAFENQMPAILRKEDFQTRVAQRCVDGLIMLVCIHVLGRRRGCMWRLSRT